MSIPKPVAGLDWCVNELTVTVKEMKRLDSNNETTIDRIHVMLEGHPRAARWDTAATANKPYCWLHERDVIECHRLGESCLADDIVGTSDTTGDTAAALADRKRTDQASTDLQAIERIHKVIRAETEKLRAIADRYPAPRPATLFERSISADNAIGCESCARVPDNTGRPLWGEPMPNGSGNPYRTDLQGMLPKPMYLCGRCYSHIQGKGILPPKKELENQVKDDKRRCQCEDRRETWSKGETVSGDAA